MKRNTYPSDLTDERWRLIEPLLPPEKDGGRPREVDLREVVNGIFYLVKTGIPWRFVPHDLPPWGTVHYFYRQWRLDGTWEKVLAALRTRVRHADGRKKSPSAAIVDSQSIKTSEGGEQKGYDAGKRVAGRKRHILVDTLGLLMAVVVHSVGVQGRDGIKPLLERAKGRFPPLRLNWADAAYEAAVGWVRSFG
jgi:putative transposase